MFIMRGHINSELVLNTYYLVSRKFDYSEALSYKEISERYNQFFPKSRDFEFKLTLSLANWWKQSGFSGKELRFGPEISNRSHIK